MLQTVCNFNKYSCNSITSIRIIYIYIINYIYIYCLNWVAKVDRLDILQVGQVYTRQKVKNRDHPTEYEIVSLFSRFCRAVAYRWLIRWLCGCIGWGNTCPLSACIYHNIRTTFGESGLTGFRPSDKQ